jgi:peptide deformylase
VEVGQPSEPDLLPITLLGNPILRSRCPEVTEFGDDLAVLVDEMFRTLHATEFGVGLSANQVGRRQRVFIFDFSDGRVGHVVNPVITAIGAQLQAEEEACLSLPGLGLMTSRPEQCAVRGFDRDGAPVAYEGDGLMARCFQHELDHLNGKLYLDLHPVRVRKQLESDARQLAWSGIPALDPRSPTYRGEVEGDEPRDPAAQ